MFQISLAGTPERDIVTPRGLVTRQRLPLSRNQTSRKNIIPFRSSTREIWNITLGIYMKTATFLVRFTAN